MKAHLGIGSVMPKQPPKRIDHHLKLAARGKRLLSGHGVIPSNNAVGKHGGRASVGTSSAPGFFNPDPNPAGTRNALLEQVGQFRG